VSDTNGAGFMHGIKPASADRYSPEEIAAPDPDFPVLMIPDARPGNRSGRDAAVLVQGLTQGKLAILRRRGHLRASPISSKDARDFFAD